MYTFRTYSFVLMLKEFQIAEQPSIITLIESTVGSNLESCSICVGYKHQFDIITDGSGTAQRLFAVQEGTKAHLVSATDLYEDEEPELLLCYNSTYIFLRWILKCIASLCYLCVCSFF